MRTQCTVSDSAKQHFTESLLPIIQGIARRTWRAYRGEREDWQQDVAAVAWKGYLDCLGNGNTSFTARSLADFAVRRVSSGRRITNRSARSYRSSLVAV